MFNIREQPDFERIKDQKSLEIEIRRRIIDKTAEKKRHLRQVHIKRKEALEEEQLQRAKAAADLKVRQHDRTHRLAEELARRKQVEQQESLKTRKKKFAVTLPKEIFEKLETDLEKEEWKEEVAASNLIPPWNLKEDLIKQQEEKLKYRRDLQNQLIDNRRRLREKEEEKHRERKIIEEVNKVLHEENVEAEKKKKEIAITLQTERDAFLKAREFWKEKRKEILKQEHDEISRIVAKREALQKREAEGKIDIREAKDVLLEKMMKKLTEEEYKRLEREEICRELYIAEKEQQLKKEAITVALKKKQTAKEFLQEMARTQKNMAERKAKEIAIDVAFANYLIEERKKQEEKEKERQQLQRERILQYGNDLRKIIDENKIKRIKELKEYLQIEDNTNDNDKCKIKSLSESVLSQSKKTSNKPELDNENDSR
ncbi:meiosis-specific nuclear structural protein 1 [Apis mellifera]|uniref:Meiosis-specific nuclear structural protein 1 n=1 Tax=Apis mellifera TaxID=7460 RepID=A0A7M7GVP8_APIME|nr:meiosis-specific nuclear structural protein 1 [Apis mellifera]|eukprot:XP_006563783.2 meiosis-specific nuclear structural protein 1 [Apis mellifera]